VTNVKSFPARGRVRVAAQGSARDDWLQVQGDLERNFRADETHQFTVRAAIPNGTPAGTYSFRLDVVNVANPQEDFTEGDTVAVQWKPDAVEPPRPFPWWLVAAAVLLVVGVSGGLYFAFRPGSEPTPVTEPEPKSEPQRDPIALVADFTATPQTGPAPLTVTFQDTSKGNPTSWTWVFGDESAAFTNSATHRYEKLGSFDVSLRIRDAHGTEDTENRARFITVGLATPKPLVPATHPIPPELILPQPAGGIRLTSKVLFKWEPVPLAKAYQVDLQHRSPNTDWANSQSVRVFSGTTTSLELGPIPDWRWRVAAMDETGEIKSKPSDWLEFGG
jgi:PKD repeat protein